jgi:hypothetical protein
VKWIGIGLFGGLIGLFLFHAARDLNVSMARIEQSQGQALEISMAKNATAVRGSQSTANEVPKTRDILKESIGQRDVGKLESVDSDVTKGGLNSKDRLNQIKLLKLFEQKKYQEAYDFAEHIKSSSGPMLKKWLLQQSPVLLIALGWAHVGNHQCLLAVALFNEALALRDEAEATRGLLVCAHEAGRKDEVLSLSDKLLGAGIKDSLVLSLRSDALESDGRFEEAKELFEGNKDKKRALERRSELSQRQSQARANHFQITFEPTMQEFLLDDVISFLEDCLGEFNQLGFPFPSKTIEVVLYRNRDFTGVAGGQPNWAEGLFDGRMRIPVSQAWKAPQKEMRFAMVLRHELAHALLHESGVNIPIWADEGLAQRMACLPFGCSAVGGRSKFHQMKLLEGSFLGLKAEEARTAYQQSLYLIYSLEAMLGPGGLKELVESALLGGTSRQITERLGMGSWQQIYSDVSKKYEQGVQFRPQ